MKKLLIQAVKFVGISGIGWLMDFAIFNVLTLFYSNVSLNNFISSTVGVTFVFLFATRKVFENNSKISLVWKYVIYIVYQFLLILLASKVLAIINTFIIANITVGTIVRFSAVLSKIIITPFTMVLNFFVMKGLIERI